MSWPPASTLFGGGVVGPIGDSRNRNGKQCESGADVPVDSIAPDIMRVTASDDRNESEFVIACSRVPATSPVKGTGFLAVSMESVDPIPTHPLSESPGKLRVDPEVVDGPLWPQPIAKG